jgi:hypothetical protein
MNSSVFVDGSGAGSPLSWKKASNFKNAAGRDPFSCSCPLVIITFTQACGNLFGNFMIYDISRRRNKAAFRYLVENHNV